MYISLISCEKNYTVEPSKSKLVLNSFVSPQTKWSIKLSTTKSPYYDNIIQNVQNASISVLSGGSGIGFFKYEGNGIYTTDYIPKANDILEVKVDKEGFKEISASSSIPRSILLYGLSKEFVINSDNEKNVKYTFYGSSPCDYLIIRHIVYKESVSLNNDTIPFIDTVSIVGVGDIYEDVLPSYANTKILFIKKKSFAPAISFQSYDGFIKNDNIVRGISTIEVLTCSKEFYDFQKSSTLFKWNNREVNTTIINSSGLYSNVNNGLGIFAGFNKRILLDTFK